MSEPAATRVSVLHEGDRPPVGLAARLVCAPIRLYRVVFAGRASPCRYWPSCSQYAIDAIEGHGATRGSLLAARRLVSCHPWTPGGVDPVPDPRRRAMHP